ncbi:hypothetical protein LINPERHAP2_LOCUS35338, partial [Linum perenne]
MRLLCWNVRGAGLPLIGNHLHRMVNQFCPSILFFMETKQNQNFLDHKRMRFNYAGSFYVDPIGMAGGLCLWWKTGIDVRVISSSKNHIDVWVDLEEGFYITFVHAPSTIANALVDLGCSGDPFTWSNNQEGAMEIKELLDRALGNQEWVQMFENATVMHELPIGSDHSPLIIDLSKRRTKKSIPFRFDTRWLKNQYCEDLVRESWKGQGNSGFKLE